MLQQSTIKKLNAISLAISLIEEAGVSTANFEINDLPDEEVTKIAQDRESLLIRPSDLKPFLHTTLKKGSYILIIRGIRKKNTGIFN